MILKLLNIALILILNVNIIQSQQGDSYCQVLNGQDLICTSFTSFAQLNLSYFQPDQNKTFQTLQFFPSTKLFLDNSLNLFNLSVAEQYELKFININKFDLLMDPLKNIDPTKQALIEFQYSYFDFLYSQEPITVDTCNFLIQNNFEISLLKNADYFVLQYAEFDNNSPLCPILFKNAKLSSFEITNINKTNKFAFIDESLLHFTTDFLCKIDNFQIDTSDFVLDKSILNKYVFQSLTYLSIKKSLVRNIQENLFETFISLDAIEFELLNFHEFISINANNSWLKNINLRVQVDLNNMNEVNSNKNKLLELYLTDLYRVYDYPNKDFCLFKDFPHNRLVVPIIKTKDNLECSCTLLWLLKYKNIYEVDGANPINTDSVSKCISNPNFDQMVKDCDFDSRIKQCNGDNSNEDNSESDSLLITTIIFGILTALLLTALGLIIYIFKFRKITNTTQSMSFKTFAASQN